MIKKIDHIVITTNDIDQCLVFYQIVGFEHKLTNGRHELFAGDFKINVHIKGSELLPHAEKIQVGSVDLCFEIENSLHTYKTKLEEKGIKIEVGIVSRMGVNGSMNSIYVRDPDGNLLEFCSYE